MEPPKVSQAVRNLLGSKQGQELLKQAGQQQPLTTASKQVLEQMHKLKPSS